MKPLPTTLRVQVSEDDFLWAEQGQTNRCPQARAIQKRYDDVGKSVHVGESTIRITERATGDRYVWPSPAPCTSFIKAYDPNGRKGVNGALPDFTLKKNEAVRKPFRKPVRLGKVDANKRATAKVARPGRSTRSMRAK